MTKPAKGLAWKSSFGGGFVCRLSSTMTLVANLWRGHYAAVYVGNVEIYRSGALPDMEAAKRECIREGTKVAQRLAKEYAEVAELLAEQGGVE